MADTLVAVDYVVIAITLLISIGVGIYYRFTGGKQKSTEEYFVAERSMSIVPVTIGLTVSFLSAVSLLGVSSENYVYGTQYSVINIAYGLATPFVVYVYLPVFFELGATSAFEYLEKRYGTTTRVIASLAFLMQLLLYTGVVLYAPALALEATTGFSSTASVIVVGLICTFYSTIGGIKAVLITDVFQSFLMLAAIVALIITAVIDAGGVGRIWEIAAEGSRLEFDNVSIDPTVRHTWWSVTFGGFFTYLSLFGVNQVQVQRMLTVKDLKTAQRAVFWSWPMASIISLATCFSGLAIYSRYRRCDPLASGRISSTDQLMPLYVMDALSSYPGVPGLFVAGIFGAGLSTISATVNSLAAIILEDYMKPIFRAKNKELSSVTSIVASKILAFVVGLACLAVAFLAKYLGGLLQAALTIFGVVGGPMLGLFTLGMFTETANETGAVSGLLIGLVFSLWIGFGQPKPPIPRLHVSTDGCNGTLDRGLDVSSHGTSSLYGRIDEDSNSYFYLYRISYMWYCPLGFLITLIIGWVISQILNIFIKQKLKRPNLNLLAPMVASRLRAQENLEEYPNKRESM